nr:MAG TPA: hypothetical protein [Caudoviricetes sp.]
MNLIYCQILIILNTSYYTQNLLRMMHNNQINVGWVVPSLHN